MSRAPAESHGVLIAALAALGREAVIVDEKHLPGEIGIEVGVGAIEHLLTRHLVEPVIHVRMDIEDRNQFRARDAFHSRPRREKRGKR